jgi:hypothetical protein
MVALRVFHNGSNPVNSSATRNALAMSAIIGNSHDSSVSPSVRAPLTMPARTSVI